MAAEKPSQEGAPLENARRLFFALWPDEAMRQAMAHATADAVRGSGGRAVPAHNLHVTLAFLGSVPERRLGELGEIARAATLSPDLAGARAPGRSQSAVCESADFAGDSLELTFERLEYWRPAQLLCALPAESPAPIVALARRLQDRLAASGLASDLKSSQPAGFDIIMKFRPHVTLARKILRRPHSMEMKAVAWSFAELVLVESKTHPEGAVYRVLESFALASPARE